MNKWLSLASCAAAWLASPSPAASAPLLASTSPDAEPQPRAFSHAPSSRLTLPSREEAASALLAHYDERSDERRDARARDLQGREKFSALNSLFAKISLRLPDATVSRSGLDLTITELICRDLNVRDIAVSHKEESATSHLINVDVQGLRINCSFRWEYKWSFFNGRGSGSARLDPSSSASAALRFESEDYGTHPPRDVAVPRCDANVQIADMNFDGDGAGIVGGVINLFEGLLRDTVEGELSTTVCDELNGLGDDALDELILRMSDEVDAYLLPLAADLADPLFLENTAVLPLVASGENEEDVGDSLYLDFQRLEEYAGEWVNSALNQVNAFLGTGTEQTTAYDKLGINTFVRENFLDENRKFVVDPSLFFEDGNVFEGHDALTETTMSIQSIQIGGLDSFLELDLLEPIGKHTLRNAFKLDYLHVAMEMEAEMKASSLSEAVIVAPGSPPVKEKFTVSFTATGIEVDASVFLGINVEALGNLELGSLLHSENILPCFLDSVDEAAFTGLSLSVADMTAPNLSGFLDAGIDHLISEGAEALFGMYERVLLKAMPNFFQTYVRDLANDFVKDALDGYSCPANAIAEWDGHVDFRDVFYSRAEAELAGGSGDGRYGDVVPWVMNMVDDQLFAADEDGLLAINDMLIGPMTKSQSGVAGTLKMNGTLIDLEKDDVERDIWKAFADYLRLTMSDLTISGLDTLREPFKVLEPRQSSAHLLESLFALGSDDRPLDASVRFGIEVAGSSLATDNVMDLKLTMPSLEVLAVLFATVRESRFMKFPLKDLLNWRCWMSTIPVSTASTEFNVGLAMHYLDVLLDGIRAKTSCVSCSNRWLEDFNSIVEFLDEIEFISGLKTRALSIVGDLLKGNWVRGMVDKQIEEASRLCPHDAAFGSPLPESAYPSFRGTYDLVDGILFAAFPVVEVIAYVMAQKHSDLDVPPPIDVSLDVPDGANLIDYTDLSSVAGWADMALDEVRNYLGGVVEGSQDLGITSMLKSLALDENGLLTIPMVDEGFEAGGVKLSLYDVTMVGMDSFSMFDVLKAATPNSLGNSIRLQRLGVTLKMGLSVEDHSSEAARLLGEHKMETVTVSLILRDVDIDASLLMAMDQDLVGGMKLGSILNTNQIFPCLLSTMHSVGLSQFVMGIGDIDEFSISGFISEDTNKSIESMTKAILAEYKQTVLDAIPAFTSVTVRPILDNLLQVFVEKAREGITCPAPVDSLDGLVDLRDLFLSEERARQLLGSGNSPYGDLFRMLYGFIDDMMSDADENGLSKLNTMVASLTERQSNEGGDLYYPGELFGQKLPIDLGGLKADIELGVYDLRVSNLDSLGDPIEVIQPVKGEPSVLNNTATMGAGNEAFRTEFRLLIKGSGSEVEVHNDLVLGLSLKNVDMMLELLAQIREAPFVNFPLQDVLNIQCWLATVVTPVLNEFGIRVGDPDGIVLRKIALAVAEARLDIECIECSSPLVVEMASSLGTEEAIADTTEVANMIFDYVTNLLGGDFIKSEIDKILREAPMKCPHSPTYNQNFPGLEYEEMVVSKAEDSSYGFLIAVVSVMVGSAIIALLTFIVARFISKRRHNRWLKTLNRAQKLDLEKMQKEEKQRERDLDSRMTSLIRAKEIPLFIRLFIPVVILGNIALFLSGHLSLGGTVNISGSFAGQTFNVEGFFEFSMAKSTIEMWKAGAKSLAILIVIFSGAWPYIKQLLSLFVWFAPPRWLSSNRRGSILRWLDVLGKWSMVDVFVLLMTLASFKLSVESPDNLSFLPESLYSLNMLVRPLWGLYANMMAQFVSQISSHVIIHYHRKTVKAAHHSQQVSQGLESTNLDGVPEKLRMHKFALDYEASSKRAVVRRSVHWVLAAVITSFMVLVVLGCVLPSFSISVLGIVGLAVESGNEFKQANDFYSVFGLASMIMDQGRYLGSATDLLGLGTLASLLVVSVFLIPLAQAISLFAQWFAPMSKKQRLQNAALNEILSAWQYMEVYVLSIVIAAWQLGGVSEYMINAYCGSLQGTFNSLSYYGILREEDAQCFKVNAAVEQASWILVAASLLLFILNHFVVGASSQKVQDDEVPTSMRLHSDRWGKMPNLALAMTLSVSADEEEGTEMMDFREPVVAPIKPRFTDYYYFATKHTVEEPSDHEDGVETAVLPETESA